MHTLWAAVHVGDELRKVDHLYDHLRTRLFGYREYVPADVVLESLGGAAAYALSSVLQQHAAIEQDAEHSMRLNLLVNLFRNGRWLLGILAGTAGYGLQFLALRHGSLALVTPLFVTGLVFALGGGALAAKHRLSRTDWLSTLSVMGGLALFLALARPGLGHPRAPALGWVLLGVVSIGVVAGLVMCAGRRPRQRSLALGAATGVLFGVTSAVTERVGHLLDHHSLLHALADWGPYALLAVAAAAMLLNQSAFQAGDLKWSLPAITVLEPLTAILIGQLLFSEKIALSAGAIVGEVAGLVLMVVGVFFLAASPAVNPDAIRSPAAKSAVEVG